MNDFIAELRKIPPVTRLLCASSLAVTLPVILQVLSPYKVLYVQQLVFQKWELWRLYTSFFFGSTGINYVFDLVMLYRNSDSLESGPYMGKSADYAWQLLVASCTIIALNTPLSTYSHSRPLLLCLTYLSSALAPPGAQTSLMGLVTLPVSYLPYVMVGMDLVMGGPGAAAQSAAGAVAGHLWWWGVHGTGGSGGALAPFGRAPMWIKNLLGETGPARAGGGAVAAGPAPAAGANAGGGIGGVHVIPPRRMAAGSTTTTTTTTGYQWGSGNRLGDH